MAVEPQVFSLLRLLIEHRDRMVSKDEIVDEVWNGRAISDASIANRMKFARSAVGDNGRDQHTIRTVHGQGFRFVADVSVEDENGGAVGAASSASRDATDRRQEPLKDPTVGRKPSIAVLPFSFLGDLGSKSFLTEAIPHDLIQALSRLRWMFVIARGTAFRFRSAMDDPQTVGQVLGVRYLLTGSIESQGRRLAVTTELADTVTGGVVWGERFEADQDDIHQIRQDLVSKVVASLEVYIPLNEAQSARLSVSENLDAWANYHLGLQRMYRFTEEENEAAARHFAQAIEQDPEFARAHAGLSFTSFQSAFLKYGQDQSDAQLMAQRYGEKSVELDPLDPFANLNMGRALMLGGDLEGSIGFLDKAITLSPNYSQGYYSHAFSDMLAVRTNSSLPHFETALALSPLDPFVYAMLAGCCLSHAIDGDYKSAAEAGEKAAKAPGAHYIIDMIALVGHSLNQDEVKSEERAKRIRSRRPDASQALFFESMPFANEHVRKKISGALGRYGF